MSSMTGYASTAFEWENQINHGNENIKYKTVISTNATAMNTSADKNSEHISVKQGQKFTLQLQSNPTTGYQWIPLFNNSIINLASHTFKPSSLSMGASGIDTFIFTGVSYGQTTLELVYKRSWDEKMAEQKVFLVNVT